ncbi:MAG: RQC domain-containing protein, partial [Pseudomonadota bacterium]
TSGLSTPMPKATVATITISSALARAGVPAEAYHAGLEPVDREARQRRFTRADEMVMVATVAFGMGVDKPDVRFVLQADLPKSIEAYYQEIGRAGRDGLAADTLTLYGLDDIKLARMRIDESGAPEERRRADHARLNALLALAEAPHCRRQTLLAYFGETTEPCGYCDLCRNPPAMIEGTEIAQMALSAMLRSEERFGLGHVVNILRGQADDKIRRFGHDRLKTFGVGAAHGAEAWKAWMRQIYALGLAEIDAERHGAWRVTAAGWEVLRGERPVALRAAAPPAVRRARTAGGRAEVAQSVAPGDEALFEALRSLRGRLAREAGVPAYVVFNDRTLVDMTARRPADLEAMAAVHGVGRAKLERFGADFLAEIRAHS